MHMTRLKKTLLLFVCIVLIAAMALFVGGCSGSKTNAADSAPQTTVVAEDGSVHMTPAPKGTLVNAVGAGDSMVAGFLAGWQERHDYGHAFRMGVSAGSASAFSRYLATREEVERVYAQLI